MLTINSSGVWKAILRGFGQLLMSIGERQSNLGREADADVQKRVKLATDIFAKYGAQIRAIIHFHITDKSKIDDIFQDFFLSILHKPVPEGIQNIEGYLYKAVTNDVIDAVRRTKSYRDRIHRSAEYRKYSIVYEDPQNIVIQAEERQKMFQLIERLLPPREAEAVIERYGYDRSIGDASTRMHVNKRTFSRYLCMGLKKIRKFLPVLESESHQK
jgi:RNA polymerase sigma factor (sigma-70 family)